MKLLDVVALTQNSPDLDLYKGQVGTIVEVHEPTVFKVDFVDPCSKTYTVETLGANQLMQLYPFQP
ncbi:MAG: DUF4926 domain-containing protein [Nodosilinea sp. WJT8-NPBG4]|jgi:hypothetical protein|nr:DUF4926 domain-containing protein [Nodosilinea sp. WJT8-NPBG4]